MLLNMRRLKARETREWLARHPEVRVSSETIYDLVLAETGSVEAAEAAHNRHMAAVLRNNETPV